MAQRSDIIKVDGKTIARQYDDGNWRIDYRIDTIGGHRRFRDGIGKGGREEIKSRALAKIRDLQEEHALHIKAAERQRRLTLMVAAGEVSESAIDGRQEMTLFAALTRYMAEHGEKKASASSMRCYNAALLDHFGPDIRLSEINANQLLKWRTVLFTRTRVRRDGGKPLRANTVRQYLNHYRRIMNRARDHGNIRVGSVLKWAGDTGVLPIHGAKTPRVIAGSVEFEKIMVAVEAAGDLMPLFRFALLTGQRQENCYALEKAAVKWDSGWIELFIKAKSDDGTGEFHRVPITTKIAEILRSVWDHHPERVFTYLARSTRTESEIDPATSKLNAFRRVKGERYAMTVTALRLRWDEVREAAGCLDLNWHRLRETAASYLQRMTGDASKVMGLTGHKDIKTFMGYTGANAKIDAVREMMETFDIEEALKAPARFTSPAAPSETAKESMDGPAERRAKVKVVGN